MDDYEVTVDETILKIDSYIDCFLGYLKTGEGKAKPKQFTDCYLYIIKLCDEADKAKDLYEIYKNRLNKYVQEYVIPSINKKQGQSKEFLEEYCRQWDNWTLLVLAMKKMFDYLDRYFLKNGQERNPHLIETALIIFKENVFLKEINEIRRSILNEIEKDRLDEMVEYDVIKGSIYQFLYMGYTKKIGIQKLEGGMYIWKGEKNLTVYDREFEKFLRDQTNEFYMKKAATWSDQYNCYEYIRKISQHLIKEESNADNFLQPETKQKILDIVLKNTVENQAEALTLKESGCEYMFNEKKTDQLTMMYKVFSRVDSTLKFIIAKMNDYIMKEGKKIVENTQLLADPIKFTQSLLEFKAEMDQLIQISFKNDMKFQKARDSSFQAFMNECDKSPHYIAFYVDFQFKKGMKQVSQEEIDSRIDAIIRLFCCLHGRDTFISSYTNLLAQRLLNKTSVSDEIEKLCVQKLQVECGHNTVNKIKTMMQDIQNSQNFMNDFKTKNGGSSLVHNSEFTCEILTSGHWPYQDANTCTIPKQLTRMKDTFAQFYRQKYQNRQMIWLYNHGTVQLQTNYLKKDYQPVVNCFQASILCLFNNHDVLTYSQIKEKAGLSDQDIKDSMLKLCNPKIKIILKEKPGKPSFDPEEKMKLNMDFFNNSIRFNLVPVLSSIKMAEGAGGIKSTADLDQELQKERSMIIDAVIVRIMKARKVENHQKLVEAVIKQTTMFQAQPQMIKKRIESLIERDYLERDESDKARYIYKP